MEIGNAAESRQIKGCVGGSGVLSVGGNHREAVICLDGLAAHRKGGAVFGHARALKDLCSPGDIVVQIGKIIVVLFVYLHRSGSACAVGQNDFVKTRRKGIGRHTCGELSVGAHGCGANIFALGRNGEGGTRRSGSGNIDSAVSDYLFVLVGRGEFDGDGIPFGIRRQCFKSRRGKSHGACQNKDSRGSRRNGLFKLA